MGDMVRSAATHYDCMDDAGFGAWVKSRTKNHWAQCYLNWSCTGNTVVIIRAVRSIDLQLTSGVLRLNASKKGHKYT